MIPGLVLNECCQIHFFACEEVINEGMPMLFTLKKHGYDGIVCISFLSLLEVMHDLHLHVKPVPVLLVLTGPIEVYLS